MLTLLMCFESAVAWTSVLFLINPSSNNTFMKRLLRLEVSAAMDMVVTETAAWLWEQSYAHTSLKLINRVTGFLRVLYSGPSFHFKMKTTHI